VDVVAVHRLRGLIELHAHDAVQSASIAKMNQSRQQQRRRR
jgi:hypothetical protein